MSNILLWMVVLINDRISNKKIEESESEECYERMTHLYQRT